MLNRTAQAIVDSLRGENLTYVFTYKDKPILRIHNSAWKKARHRASLDHVRVHDLRHTFGRRLRSAGVSFEDWQDLLGHKSARITTHYSGAELYNLIEAANRVCERKNCGPVLRMISRPFTTSSRESHEPELRVVK